MRERERERERENLTFHKEKKLKATTPFKILFFYLEGRYSSEVFKKINALEIEIYQRR